MSLKVWLPLCGDLTNKGAMSNAATGTNITVDASGKIGQCYSFDGYSSYIKLDTAPFDNSATGMSYACWFKPTASNQAMCLFSNRTAVNYSGFSIFAFSENTKFLFDTGARLNATMPSNIVVNEWHHLAFTWHRSTGKKKIWVDGICVSSGTQTELPTQANPAKAFIGASQDSSTTVNANYLKGCLNDVRIYDHCLSAAEIKELSQGLVLHYRLNGCLGGSRENLISDAEAEVSQVNTYHAYPFTADQITAVTGQVCTISVDIKASVDNTKCDAYFRSSSGMLGTSIRIENIGTEYKRYSITMTAPSGDIVSFALRNNSSSGSDTTATYYYRNIKIELGATDTAYIPSNLEATIDKTKIIDCSGYDCNAVITGTLNADFTSPRYNMATVFPSGANYAMTTISTAFANSYTFAWWGKSTNTNVMPWGYGDGNRLNTYFTATTICLNTGDSTNNPFGSISTATYNDGTWHHYVVTGDGTTTKLYIDGEFKANAKTYRALTGTKLYISGWNTTSSYKWGGSLSDLRIYATALSADDIFDLYQTSAKIDNLGNMHGYEFDEDSGISVKNTGIVMSDEICELPILSKLKYDPNIYIEPDGSVWVRVYHHNNPASYLFASTDTFASSVYIDENRWFNVEVCNDVDKWEIMFKGKYTSDGAEWKTRWIQQYNPMTATFANVAAANVTKITTDGYVATSTSYGGLYKRTYGNGGTGSYTYLCANNGTESNWFGAVGAWSAHQGGIPGWFAGNAAVTTTGYNDMYLRIDNVTISAQDTTQFKKSGAILSHQFIES